MDKDILKLLPQKAFKLLSFRETLKIGTMVTKSMFDKDSYEKNFKSKLNSWKFKDINLTRQLPSNVEKLSTKEDGEKVLKIYFSQFFEKQNAVHIDLRSSSFACSDSFCWMPSKLHYVFSPSFLEGVCLLYEGFYFEHPDKFQRGLFLLGMITESMTELQKTRIIELFKAHFGEGQTGTIRFSLENLHRSFNEIFSFFLKEDVPLNPEFAVLGVNLVTLYLTLQELPHELNVSEAFREVFLKYQAGV